MFLYAQVAWPWHCSCTLGAAVIAVAIYTDANNGVVVVIIAAVAIPPKLEGTAKDMFPQEWLCVVCNVGASFAFVLLSLSLLPMLVVKTSAN
jgi:hypothetical protein